MESFKEAVNSILTDDILNIYQRTDLSKSQANPLIDYICTRKPVAFQELFIPVVKFAREKLRGRFFTFLDLSEPTASMLSSCNDISLLKESAFFSLEYNLLEILSVVSSKVLAMEFSLFRARYQSPLDRLLCSNTSTTHYTSYINNMYKGDFVKLLTEYPGLLKLFAVVTMQWLDTTNELLARLETDITKISNVFNSREATGKVTDIAMGFSDRHNGGHTVAIISFDSGFKLVYKPRSLGMEEAWFNLLHHLNNVLSHDLFKCVKVLNKDTYGWMEYVEHLPCRDENEISQYYHRAGAILCMVHIFRGTDCHYQNLIAHGSFPVLIDLETLFHPYTRELNINTREYSAEDMENYYSVLRTGLLPSKGYVQDGKSFDLSGFGGGTPGYPKVYKWVDINTDNTRQEYANREITMPFNLPYIGDKVFPAVNYVNGIIDGFEKTYEYIMQQKDDLLSSELFQTIAQSKCRFVFRPTALYFALLSKCIEPKYLKSGIEISELNQELSKNINDCHPLSDEEFHSLQIHDIPYFYVDTSTTKLSLYEEQKRTVVFLKSSFDSVTEYIMQMQQDDLVKQTQLIRIALNKD